MRVFLFTFLFLLSLTFSAQAISISVDGSLGDWGLDTSNFGKNGNNWDPGVAGVFVWQEDEVGNNGYVGPGYGGQKYDVEAVFATFDAEYLYIAIVTGFPQEGTSSWKAGDIAIDLGNDGSYDYAFAVVGHDSVSAGELYKVSTWENVSYSAHSVSNPWRMEDGYYKGEGSLAYVDDPDHSFPRYFIEVGIPLSLFEETVHKVKIHWTMECGNDYGEVVAHTPEPASILLLGAGLFALGVAVRRKRGER